MRWHRTGQARRSAPPLSEYRELIDEWLVADQLALKQQRHALRTASRRLVDERGVKVAGTTVRDHACKRRELGVSVGEVFVPRCTRPSPTAEVDWGEAEVELAGGWQFTLTGGAGGGSSSAEEEP